MSIRDYMSRYGFNMNGFGKRYVVIDSKVTDTRGGKSGTIEEIRHVRDEWWIANIQMYDYTSTIKVIAPSSRSSTFL